ncbi:hypothetical protein OE88DRAFT_1651155 [Heliocybe sulcata]|uniref:Nucleolar 27S pre-rRNA processing Urb2/Npa2 C-terminal domain-containing protein n=1 Tax=Heliocybe sulcata TaxID=5364 RepID=A0A5C3NMN5_9AGAM|nr:hypothetical protein OE88DRAFT_1651155 [Heliocybe sulcata]
MSWSQSAQGFVRALKSPADPPQVGEPLKIEIARIVWDRSAIYIPNKAQIVYDWILTKFLKERGNEGPVIDVRYWKLLSDIITCTSGPSASQNANAKSQLLALLNKTPLAPIVTSVFSLSPALQPRDTSPLFESVRKCIDVLWPLAVPKFTAESLLECWAAFVGSLLSRGAQTEVDENYVRVGSRTCESYRSTLANSSNKKKLYRQFVQSHLSNWLSCTGGCGSTTAEVPLLSSVYSVGIETLFNLDMLRNLMSVTPITSDALFSNLLNLVKSSPETVTRNVPDLFLSYVQAIKRHRSADFGSGSSGQANAGLVGQIQGAGLRFFVACDVILRDSPEDSPAAWTARVRLLQIVEQEALFGGQVQGFGSSGETDEEAHLMLKQIVTDAIKILESVTGAEEDATTALLKMDLAVQCITVSVKIDYELVSPSISRLLQALLALPLLTRSWGYLSEKACLEQQVDTLLTSALSHHSKTRTLPSYLETFLSTCTSLDLPPVDRELSHSQSTYRVCHESRLLSQHHLSQMSRSCLAYVTPSQIPEVVDSVCDALQQMHDAFTQSLLSLPDGEASKPKKRKGSQADANGATPSSQNLELAVIRFTLVSKLAGAVLPCLPLQSLTADNRREVAGKVRAGAAKAVILPALKAYISSSKKHGAAESPKKRKAASSKGDQSVWATQTVAAAALRLDYAIAAASHGGLYHSVLMNEEEAGTKELLLQSFSVDLESATSVQAPELIPEMARSLLKSELGFQLQDALFSATLGYLGKYLDTSVGWGGMVSELDHQGAHNEAAVALLYNLSDRWLGTFEKSAPASELNNLAAVIMNLAVTTPHGKAGGKLYAHNILSLLLRNAEFWELSRLRAALTSRINALTAPYEKYDLSDLLAQITGGDTLMQNPTIDDLEKALAVYKFLLHVPQEYISRSSGADLLKRAAILDVITTMESQRKASASVSTGNIRLSDILSIRAFLVRTYKHMGTADEEILAEMADYLLGTIVYLGLERMDYSADSMQDNFTALENVTLELLRIYTSAMIKKAEKGDDSPLLEFLTRASRYASFPGGTAHERNHLAERCLLHVVDDLTSGFALDSFSAQIQACFKTLHNSLFAAVTQNLTTLALKDGLPEGHLQYLEAWPRALRFGHWLQSDTAVNPLGQDIVVKVSPQVKSAKRTDSYDRLCRSILSVLLEEYRYIPNIDRQYQVEIATAFYITSIGISSSEGREGIDGSMSRFSKALSVRDFTHVLDLISEAALSSRGSPAELRHLIHLSTLLLRDPPEGTLKVTQSFVTECLNMFANHDIFTSGPPSILLAVLMFISRHFSERPAAVRAQDVNNVWSLMSRLLSGCDLHDEYTSDSIFQQIVNTLSALIRLRRDLLLPTLPHLGFVLRQLIKATRTIRPHLGGKQTKMVTDTLPMWMNASQPLPIEASRALGRLLTSLGTKTIVRTHGTAGENQKAESLAKPFSKHAAYVLQAYIEAMNDPLCVMPSEVRKELYPGLFALCDMMNDHNRDAMMVSALDSGGKATLKSLWKDYEKQKYVGKG